MRIFNAMSADGNGRLFGNSIAAYLGIDAGIFHVALEYGGRAHPLKYLDTLSREKSIGSAAVECTPALANGLGELRAKFATDHNYIHACQLIYPKVGNVRPRSAKSCSSGLDIDHWYVCQDSHSVKSKITKKVNDQIQDVEISLWAHPNAKNIRQQWATDIESSKKFHAVTRPTTHQMCVTISPRIQLFNEPCSIGIELSGSIQLMHRAELDLQEDGCTRLVLSESYKVKEFKDVFSQGKCFGMLVFQGHEKKWAQFFPQMQGFDECYEEMDNEDYLPPVQAA